MLRDLWLGASEPREHVSCCRRAELFLIFCLPTEVWIGSSRPTATVCKFPADKNYAVTQASATEFEPGTVRVRIQRATTAPPRHTVQEKPTNCGTKVVDVLVVDVVDVMCQ